LSACHPEICLRPEPTGIVQTRSSHGKVLDRSRSRRKQRRAATGTELPFRNIAAVSNLLKMRGLALRQLHDTACHDQGRREATSAGELAVAAMAIEHSKWQREAFIADSATRAAAGEWSCGARQGDACAQFAGDTTFKVRGASRRPAPCTILEFQELPLRSCLVPAEGERA